MKNKFCQITLLLLVFSSTSIGQDKSFMQFVTKQDTNYIKKFPHRFLIGSSFFLRTNSINLKDLDGFGNPIVYRPSSPMRMGFRGVYNGIQLGFSFKIPSYLKDQDNTKSLGLFFNLQTKFLNWGVDFSLFRNSGYFLNNPDVNVIGWDMENGKPFRSDLVTTNANISTHVVFSDKLSLKAAFKQTEKQLKSAGGFALQFGFSYSALNSDSSIIPYSQQSYYETTTSLSDAEFVNLSIRPGYAFSYVRNNLSATIIAYFGVGFQVQNYILATGHESNAKLTNSFKFQQNVGYNFDEAYLNLSFSFERAKYRINQTDIKNDYLLISLGGGLRFM